MSYTITVESAGDQLHAVASGPVPDGRHVIAGHTGPDDVNLSVTRYDEHGAQLISAGSYTRREA